MSGKFCLGLTIGFVHDMIESGELSWEAKIMARTRKIVIISLIVVFSFFLGMAVQYGVLNTIGYKILGVSPLEQTCRNLNAIRKTINNFHDPNGRYPNDMNELVSRGELCWSLYSPLGSSVEYGYELYTPKGFPESPPLIYETEPYYYKGRLQVINLPNGVSVLVSPEDISKLLDPNTSIEIRKN
jgi:hypothetical protein